MFHVRLSFLLLLLPFPPNMLRPSELLQRESVPVELVLEGTVLDARGQPVENAIVVASPVTRGASQRSATTHSDQDGRFHLALQARVPQNLLVQAEGFAPWARRRVPPGEVLTIVLVEGLVLEGTVRDGKTNEPIAGARIEAVSGDIAVSLPSNPRLAISETLTDVEGRFQLQGLAPGHHTIAASARGYERILKRQVKSGTILDLTLLPGSSITGTVSDAGGRLLEGASVEVEGELRPFVFVPLMSARLTDGRGRFELFGVPPGKHRLVVRHPDTAPSVIPDVTVDENDEVEWEISLGSGARVLGRILDVEGRPVFGQANIVALNGQPAPRLLRDLLFSDTTDDGGFVIARVPAGSHTLSVRARGLAGQEIEIDVGERQAEVDVGELVLETGLTLGGRVLDETGAPVIGAELQAHLGGGQDVAAMRGEPRRYEATSDLDGSFVFAGISPGEYHLRIRAPGFAEPEPISAKAGTANIEVVLKTAGAIRGAVVDGEGQPVEVYRVTASSPKAAWARDETEYIEALDGAFVLPDLAEGLYVVEIRAPDWRPAVLSDVEVEPGGVADLGKIRLNRGGSIRGHVVDPSGSPIDGARVSVESPGRVITMRTPGEGWVRSDSSGFFEIQGIPDGQVDVVAHHPGYAPGRVEGVQVRADMGATETDITLTRGGNLEGWVRGRDGLGLSGRGIMVYIEERTAVSGPLEDRRTATDGNGYFLIEHLPPGPTIVKLLQEVRSVPQRLAQDIQTKEVVIREGETVQIVFESRPVHIYGQVTENGVALPEAYVIFSPMSDSGGVSIRMLDRGKIGVQPSDERGFLGGATRADGTYELLVDPPGRYSVLIQSLDGEKRYPLKVVEIPEADSYPLDLDFAVVTVSGWVIDEETEQFIEGASVIASEQSPEPFAKHGYGETDPGGFFQLQLEAGRYELRTSATDYVADVREVQVEEGGAPEIHIQLSRGVVLRGRVVNGEGRGIEGLRVAAGSDEATAGPGSSSLTLADGSFQLKGLSPRHRYRLFTGSRSDGFAFKTGVHLGDGAVILRLQPGGFARVQVLTPEGEPIEGACVWLAEMAGHPVPGGTTGFTDFQGTVELSLPAGFIRLSVEKDQMERKVNVTIPRQGTVPVEVVLQKKVP